MKRIFDALLEKTVALAFALSIGLVLFPAKDAYAATAQQNEAYTQELRQMLYSVDESVHNVYQYRVTYKDAQQIFENMKENTEDKWIIASYNINLYISYTLKGQYVNDIQFVNMDEDVLNRYSVLTKNVEKIKAGIEPGMGDIDKLIYLHDAIVDLASYQFVGYQSYGAGGILGENKGVCAGYTYALNLLLTDQVIPAVYLSNKDIDHGWSVVYINGDWYHVDATWDDTRSSVKGVASHRFMLRNDSEFSASGNDSHAGNWRITTVNYDVPCTSTKYTNWYVHDITGKMAYENGYWYYVDRKSNSIKRNTAEGGAEETMLNGSGMSTITLVDATPEGITYKISGQTKTIGYEPEKAPGPSEETPIAPTNAVEVTFYIIPYGNTSYINAGIGYINGDATTKDGSTVQSRIISTPDMSKWVSEDETIEWTAITKSGSGRRFVKGNVVKKPVEEEPVVEETPVDMSNAVEVTYYIIPYGQTVYVNAGMGYIDGDATTKDGSKVQGRILVMPDFSKWVGADEKIEWTAITKSGSGRRFVKGTVVKK